MNASPGHPADDEEFRRYQEESTETIRQLFVWFPLPRLGKPSDLPPSRYDYLKKELTRPLTFLR